MVVASAGMKAMAVWPNRGCGHPAGESRASVAEVSLAVWPIRRVQTREGSETGASIRHHRPRSSAGIGATRLPSGLSLKASRWRVAGGLAEDATFGW